VISREKYLRSSGALRVISPPQPKRIMVANSKGGCGKTTLATNLATFFANSGKATAMVDHDPQASSTYWLKMRPEKVAPIAGIAAFTQPGSRETRSFHNRLPRGIQRVVLDTPAALSGTELYHHASNVELIVVPILPSPMDIHATENFIHEIKLREDSAQILIVANRIRRNTVMFARLNAFLQELGLPRVTYIRDSQLYTRTAEQGLGICDIANARATRERDHWTRIGSWIENRLAIREERHAAALASSTDHLAGI
jgi:chromosome partitioning protein